MIYRICSIVNQPEKHRKIYFIVSSIHSYSIECFDVNLQIDIADKENIAFSGFQTSQRLFWKRLSETNLGPSKSIPDWIQGALLKGTVQLVMVKEPIESLDNSNAAIFVSDLYIDFHELFNRLYSKKNEIPFLCSVSVPEKLSINLWFLSFLKRSFQIRKKRWIVSSLPSDIGTMILTFFIRLDPWICNALLRIWTIWFEVMGISIGIASFIWSLPKRYVEIYCLMPRKCHGWPIWILL